MSSSRMQGWYSRQNPAAVIRKPASPVPKSEGVQFHDILYTLSREILYTSARAQASAEVLGRCRGRRWKSGSSE